jgi:hypothetical protein
MSKPYMRTPQRCTVAFRPAFFGDTNEYKWHTQIHNRSDFTFPHGAPSATMHRARHTRSTPPMCTLWRPHYVKKILLCTCTCVFDTRDKAPSKPDAIQHPVCRTQDTHVYKTAMTSPCVRGLRCSSRRLVAKPSSGNASFRRRESLHDSSASCHGSAWTPLSADNKQEDQRLEEARTEVCT